MPACCSRMAAFFFQILRIRYPLRSAGRTLRRVSGSFLSVFIVIFDAAVYDCLCYFYIVSEIEVDCLRVTMQVGI